MAVGGTRAVDRPFKKIEIVRAPRLHSTPKVSQSVFRSPVGYLLMMKMNEDTEYGLYVE